MLSMDYKKCLAVALKILLFLIFLAGSIFAFPEQSTLDELSLLAIKAGKIVRVTSPSIDNGTIIIDKGKIVSVGKDIPIPNGAKLIEYPDCQVFPGFIDSSTNLGLEDLEPEEQDSGEVTLPITPQVRVIDAFNPDNRFIALARKEGVTSALIAPSGANLISGQSAFINLAGTSLREMVLKFPAAVHGVLGEMPKGIFGKKGQMPSTRMGEVALLRQLLVETKDYQIAQEKNKGQKDFRYESLLAVIKREIPLIIQANRMSDILAAIKIAEEFNLKIIISQGAEAYRLVTRLSAKEIPVLLCPVEYYFQRVETRGASYEAARLLKEGKVNFAFQTGNVRIGNSLIHQARMAIKHGLSYEDALRALTIIPARIFGLEKEIGSIEKGKAANLVIFDDDPLAGLGKLKMVIINGQITDVF